jgi:hypothetical protein
MSEKEKKEPEGQVIALLERIQKKLQIAEFTQLAIVQKMTERVDNKFMEQDNNKNFIDFIKILEVDPNINTQMIAKKLRVAYLYINLDETPLYNPASTDIKPESKPEAKAGLTAEVKPGKAGEKPGAKPGVKAEAKPGLKAEVKAGVKPGKAEAKSEGAKPDLKAEVKTEGLPSV